MSESVQKHIPGAISLTEAAADYVRKCITKQGKGIGLRVGVKKGGCSGLSYEVDFAENTEKDDLIFPIDNQLNIYVDKEAFEFLKGTRLDYITEGLNAKLVFLNPNETVRCGCGESFGVSDQET